MKTIAVVTGSRAEFGLLEPVMRAIAAHPGLKLKTIVAGSHLVTGTWRDVARAGFAGAARVQMQTLGRSGRVADVAATGAGVVGFGKEFAKLKPDVVLVLGDRIEALAAAVAASIGGFALGHIHGGDRAEGVADEAMRHAISKLAHLHFPATALSRKRLIRMGEEPKTVFNVGSPAVDGLREVVAAEDAPELIVMQHPIGGTDAEEKRWMKQTLRATRHLRRMVMAPNGDPGAPGIWAAMEEDGAEVVKHLPRGKWLSALAGAMAIVGNSSAGLIEAAALGVACVNVGPRQAGRERPRNVVDCAYGDVAVSKALEKALSRKMTGRHPYGDGKAGEKIAKVLARMGAVSVRKRNAY